MDMFQKFEGHKTNKKGPGFDGFKPCRPAVVLRNKEN